MFQTVSYDCTALMTTHSVLGFCYEHVSCQFMTQNLGTNSCYNLTGSFI